MILRCVGIIFPLMAGSAAAQTVDCYATVTQSELNQCAFEDWKEQDSHLNAAWVKAMGVMKEIDVELPEKDRGAADLLRKGQKAWITFRDDTCAAEGYLMHGGSAEPMLVYGCMSRLTNLRTQDLNLIAEAGH